MPSFAIHAICAKELIKQMNLTEKEQKDFIIANTIPDVCRITNFNNLDNQKQRKAIQVKKRYTHFKTNVDNVLEYPNCDAFVFKYENNLKKDCKTLAYLFHLYTDYYYVKKLLPKLLTIYDENMNETVEKDKAKFVKINKTGDIFNYLDFFNKSSKINIYQDYTKTNNYLIKKYKLNIDVENLIEYIDEHGFTINIEETNSLFAYYAIIKLNKYINNVKDLGDNYLIFKKEDIDNLVNDIIESFSKEYHYLLKHYQKK